jgi:hypothetical protein
MEITRPPAQYLKLIMGGLYLGTLTSPDGSRGSFDLGLGNVLSRWEGWAQDVPTAYWRLVGAEGFNGALYTLNGPLSPWTVKTSTSTYGTQTCCSFTNGWAAFCTANDLKLGDTVIFTQVGLLEFEVSKV